MSDYWFLSRPSWRSLGVALTGAAVAAGLVGPARTLSAQTPPKVYVACYVPLTGTVYRIKESGLKTACTASHVEFSWTDGGAAGGGATAHGALTGLGDDDHPQYLLTNGVRDAVNGFAVTGEVQRGSIPISGPGVRLMWYPGKGAFRAGATGFQWEDSRIGYWSFATGSNALASGASSTAMGAATTASGDASTAMGYNTTAGGFASTATGFLTTASGEYSTAIGHGGSTNSHRGSFVYGDASVVNIVNAVAANQFVVRAQHFWFGTNSSPIATPGRLLETSTGAFLSSGGAWTNSSDVALKHDFEDVSAEDVLGKIAAMPVRRWSYKAEDPSVRHFGPTAQDFRAAFGLGAAATSIATVDADGVSLLGIQALEKRTRELERVNAALLARLERLEAGLKRPENR